MKIIINSKNDDGHLELSNDTNLKEHSKSIILKVSNDAEEASICLDAELVGELEQAISTMSYLIND